MRCFRCNGQRHVYRIGVGDGAYSLVDMGGEKVKCPMCNGEGTIVPVEEIRNYKDDTRADSGNKKKSIRPNKVRDTSSDDLSDAGNN